MILDQDRIELEKLLRQMRRIHAELDERRAGVCVLHQEAAIASLESHLRRNGVPTTVSHQASPAASRIA